jgi:hypothetical protein
MSSHNKETDGEFDERWKAYFDRPNIDGSLIKNKIKSIYLFILGWDIRQGINHMNRLDLIP